MPRLSQNTVTKETPDFEPLFQKGNKTNDLCALVLKNEHAFLNENNAQKMARQAMNDNLAPVKAWAADLNVTSKAIAQWASGERPIPPLRVGQILRQAKAYCMQVDALEANIDVWLLQTYGPAGQNMIDNGGADY